MLIRKNNLRPKEIISPIVMTSLIKENDMSSKVPCDLELSESVCKATKYGFPSLNMMDKERQKQYILKDYIKKA